MRLDKNSKKILPGSLVTLFDNAGNVLQDSLVGIKADYLFKIEPNKKYKIRGTRKAYIPQDIEFSTDINGKIQHNIFLTLEAFADAEENVKQNEKGDVQVELDKIFFDFDKSNITAQAAFELDKLIQVMNKYPELVIKAESHTDHLGSATYNQKLSERRALTTVQYVISKGIDESRIAGEGKGENNPKIDCGSKCSEEDRAANRRSEFLIVSQEQE